MRNHAQVLQRLASAITNSTLSHAYIFEGQNMEETWDLVFQFAMGIFCDKGTGTACGECGSCVKLKHDNLEDLIIIKSTGNSVKDEDIIYLQRKLRNKPFSSIRNVAIIHKADTMTIRAQNRLLKTLEEPNGNNIIILTATNTGNLISTIQSRCVSIRINDNYENESDSQIVAGYGLTKLARILAYKESLYEFNQNSSAILKDRESAKEGLEIMEAWFRNMLVSQVMNCKIDFDNQELKKELDDIARDIGKGSLIKIIECIEMAKSDLDANINVAYALKSMLLKIQEEENDKCYRN